MILLIMNIDNDIDIDNVDNDIDTDNVIDNEY